MERLADLCGGEELKAELWEKLGQALGVSDARLEKIKSEEKDNLEKCKQCVLNVCNMTGTSDKGTSPEGTTSQQRTHL